MLSRQSDVWVALELRAGLGWRRKAKFPRE